MIYDKIDKDLIKLGDKKQFNTEDSDKFLTPIYYDNGPFVFSLKNKYFKIEGIEENIYGKDFITIKSKILSDVIKTIADKVGAIDPVQKDGSVRAVFNVKTKINKDINMIRNNVFDACLSLSFPTIFIDNDKITLQIHLQDLVVIKIIDDSLQIDHDKLEEAM